MPSIDGLIAEFMEHRFMGGGAASVESLVLAALAYFHPALSRESGHLQFPLARQAVRGWRRLVPPVSPLACPEEILFLLCLEMLNLPAADFGGKEG